LFLAALFSHVGMIILSLFDVSVKATRFFIGCPLGSGLIDYSQKTTAAAMQIADK
jgi:hypothetical protein